MSKTTLSASDEWATDLKLYDELCLAYGIHPTVDVAATSKNLKCQFYLSKFYNALESEWFGDSWCNPPHSKTKAFVLKAHQQWRNNNINILMLVPAGVLCRKYFQEIFEKFILTNHGVEWHPVRPRPRFIHPDQKKQEGARQDYIVIIWRQRRAPQ